MRNYQSRKAFTIMEMLVVVAVMAIIATLATGAVTKTLVSMRDKRANAMVRGLQMALNNYRAQKNKWPFELSDLRKENNLYKADGEDNADVFKGLFESDTTFLDPSAFLTRVDGSRMTLQKALERGKTDLPLGYPEPNNPSEFKFFNVEYNLATDSVKVNR